MNQGYGFLFRMVLQHFNKEIGEKQKRQYFQRVEHGVQKGIRQNLKQQVRFSFNKILSCIARL